MFYWIGDCIRSIPGSLLGNVGFDGRSWGILCISGPGFDCLEVICVWGLVLFIILSIFINDTNCLGS